MERLDPGRVIKSVSLQHPPKILEISSLTQDACHSTIIVLFIVNLFFDVFQYLPFENCDERWLAGMSLPCVRDLWRATSSAEWEREYLARGDDMSPRKQLTYGDLLNSRSRADHTLDSWLSELDDFGTLVMAAASLTV